MNKKNKFIQTYVLLILEIICIIISYSFAHRLRYKGGQRYYEVDLIVCLSLVVFALVLSLVLDWNKFIYKNNQILVKDPKGHVFIAAISQSTDTSDIAIPDMPT